MGILISLDNLELGSTLYILLQTMLKSLANTMMTNSEPLEDFILFYFYYYFFFFVNQRFMKWIDDHSNFHSGMYGSLKLMELLQFLRMYGMNHSDVELRSDCISEKKLGNTWRRPN